MSIELINTLETVDVPKPKRCKDCESQLGCMRLIGATERTDVFDRCIEGDFKYYTRKWWKFWRPK